ncbi:MAG: helix-turn-helix transcriptional regulator [Tissierellaceae bacterium]
MIRVNLDKIMEEKKILLKDLADIVGISNVNLSNLKNNKIKAIRFSTLENICIALDCQPGDILEYVKEPDIND